MKNLMTTAAVVAMLATPALAATEATNTTDIETDTTVTTEQDSGVSLSGKAKVMPHAVINTGDNESTTEVDTTIETESDAEATTTRRNTRVESRADRVDVDNRSYNRERGKGHKHGHDRN